jgi:hypothetical protein
MSDLNIEAEIERKGLTFPRVTPESLDKVIKKADYHVFADCTLTICRLTLVNGFIVTGESACASPENFDAELGREIAYDNAKDKLWTLEGYLLKQKLYEGTL